MKPRTIAIGAFVFAASACSIAFAWSGPSGEPTSGNVDAPVNVGAVSQAKNGNLGVNGLAVFGNTILQGSSYLNWGSIAGTTGYGLWDNSGTLEYKNSGGTWAAFGSSASFTGPYLPAYTNWQSTVTGSGEAAIYNDDNSFKSLMIVGNDASGLDGGLRQVHVWDDLTVNNNLTVQGTTTAARYCIGSSCITSWPTSNATIGGSGSSPYVPVFTGATTIGNSSISSNGQSSTENGNFFVTGNENVAGDITSTSIGSDGANIRMIGGSYGAFFRNDGASTYFLLTASGSQTSTWNSLRPLTVNDSTGLVTMSNGLTANSITSSQYCIGSSCITSWPSSYTNTDTLDTVAGRGSSTSHSITVGGLTSTGVVAWGNGTGSLGTDPNGEIELGPNVSSTATPYIDFHFGTGAAQDYNVRINNSANNKLSILTQSGGDVFDVNGNSICLNGSCITSWPTGGTTNTDTLDTVTDRGNSTSNTIYVGSSIATGASWAGRVYMGASPAGGADEFDIYNTTGNAYLYAYSTAGTGASLGAYIGGGTGAGTLHLNPAGGQVQVENQIAAGEGVPGSTCGTSSNGFTFWNDGCFDTGMFSPSDGDLQFFDNNVLGFRLQGGNALIPNGNLTVSTGNVTVQGNLNFNGNQIWTSNANNNTLYLQYGAPANAGVQIGSGSNSAGLYIPDGGINMSGFIGVDGKLATSGYPSGWVGGIHTFDLYAEGTVGAGPSGGPVQAWISSNGNGSFTGDVIAAAFLYQSDERLKNDIQPLPDSLQDVLAINPVTYYWKNPAQGTGLQIGFVAQQVQSVVPELVHEDASTTLLSIDYSRVTPLLVGSVQALNQKISDQQAQINTQQQEINTLQSEIAALENAKQ